MVVEVKRFDAMTRLLGKAPGGLLMDDGAASFCFAPREGTGVGGVGFCASNVMDTFDFWVRGGLVGTAQRALVDDVCRRVGGTVSWMASERVLFGLPAG